MKKVRVVYKNPIGNKTGTMYMKEELIAKFRGKLKPFSPYKSITVLK